MTTVGLSGIRRIPHAGRACALCKAERTFATAESGSMLAPLTPSTQSARWSRVAALRPSSRKGPRPSSRASPIRLHMRSGSRAANTARPPQRTVCLFGRGQCSTLATPRPARISLIPILAWCCRRRKSMARSPDATVAEALLAVKGHLQHFDVLLAAALSAIRPTQASAFRLILGQIGLSARFSSLRVAKARDCAETGDPALGRSKWPRMARRRVSGRHGPKRPLVG